MSENIFLIASTAILVLTYFLVATEWVHRAVIALIGGGLTIAIGLLSQDEAIRAIDFNTLGLLAGMMIVVAISKKSGMFEYAAIRTAQLVRASPAGILAALALMTAIFSAFLDNVTSVLLIVPVTFAICDRLKLAPYPFLFTQIIASNIGGAATIVGDPPNIMIGSAIGSTFNEFLFALGPVVALVLALQLLMAHLIWGRRMKCTRQEKNQLMEMSAAGAIRDRYLLYASLGVIGAAILAFVLAGHLHLHLATIAMLAAAILLMLDNFAKPRHAHGLNVEYAFREIDWTTLFFFLGLFVVVGAVERAGLLRILGAGLVAQTGSDPALTAGIVLWSSAGLSAIVDNIPFVASMIPLVKGIAPALGGGEHVRPIWWSLALGACLGGNGSLIGAAANLAVAGMADKKGVKFSFMKFTALALPMMAISVAVCHVYILWRYF